MFLRVRTTYNFRVPYIKRFTHHASAHEQIAVNLFHSFGRQQGEEIVLVKDDLSNMLNSMGIFPSEEKVQEMITRVDLNKDGLIQLNEFLAGYQWLLEQDQNEDDYRAIFETLDRDNDGYITSDELSGLTTTTKSPLSDLHIDDFFKHAGVDGKVTFEQFKKILEKDKILGWRILTAFRVIFVCGGPASGKGTICQKLMELSPAKLKHISSGDLLRDEVRSQSPLGLHIADVMRRGELCDGNVVIALLEKALSKSAGTTVLLDGFPRSMENAVAFHESFGNGEFLLFFDCPDEEMKRRIVERGKQSGRLDDNEATALNRIATFHQQSREPMEFFIKAGTKVIRIDTTLPVEENVKKLLSHPVFRYSVSE
eukprot:TRINITY_DN2219_c0_g1_i1.p1 TRINITY_DN2219_c0_g1~~TRINITY_DN2219_c0_g1_i1.p1  ORF type:complete len:369 (-),score=53.10 TRINITY_DN2219_c0_g1_i1:69-1175(-)